MHPYLSSTVDRVRARPWARRLLLVAPAFVLAAMFFTVGVRGIDFGFHWDETDWHVVPARTMVATGILLPRSYIYPSVDKWLVLVPAVPAGVGAALKPRSDPKTIQAAMGAAMDAPRYLLKVRTVFLAVSTLAILWIYGAALAMRFPWWQALIAACGLALSWEFSYHARWAVTDCILLQFTALTLLMLALHHRTGKTGWLRAAAVTAGLGLGTKYPGLFLTGSVLVASLLSLPLAPFRTAYRPQLKRALGLCAIVFAVYLVTTPGTVLDPIEFFVQTRDISSYYAKTHYGYTATSAWNHGWIFLSYLSMSYFSPYLVPALLAFVVAVLGGVTLAREDRRLAAIVIACPVLFMVAFCIKYRVAVVRNTLYLTPVLSLLLARGIAQIGAWIRLLWARRVLAGALAAAMAAQALWVIAAGESVRHVDMNEEAKAALDYVKSHPADRYRVSQYIRSLAAGMSLPIPANVIGDKAPGAGHVVFFARGDGPTPYVWKVNDRWLVEAVFGPRELNFNWYSTWSGHDRVVVMKIDKARSFGVALAK